MHPPDSQKKRYQNDARPAGRAIAHATDARATHAFPVPIMPSLPHAPPRKGHACVSSPITPNKTDAPVLHPPIAHAPAPRTQAGAADGPRELCAMRARGCSLS